MNRVENTSNTQATGVILAGGQARRMGGIDKGLVELAGVSMCKIVIDLLAPQVAEVLVSANRNIETYRGYGVRVIEDEISGYLGPLAGLASAMRAANTPWVITVPCDGPFLSEVYVARMSAEDDGQIDVVVARDAERLQPTFMMARVELLENLMRFLESGERKIDKWFAMHRFTTADFSDTPDCFLNINSPEDRELVERQMMINSNSS